MQVNKNCKIPKVIHLTWFSGDEYPPILAKCIQSWKDLLPDYEIKIWNMEMAKSVKIEYVDEALKLRKWAFAGDVIRAYALYTEGGVYMDTDVFVKRRFDEFMNHDFVSFIAYHPNNANLEKIDKNGNRKNKAIVVNGIGINIAFMASVKNTIFLKKVLDYYRTIHFDLGDGTFRKDAIGPDFYAWIAEDMGFKYLDSYQVLENDTAFYPSLYFGTYDQSTFAIHLASHSWADNSFVGRVKELLVRNVKCILSYLNLYKKDERHLEYYKYKPQK